MVDFGPLIIGNDAYQQQEEAKRKGATKFGSLITDDVPAPPPPPPPLPQRKTLADLKAEAKTTTTEGEQEGESPPPPPEEVGNLTVANVRKALESNPNLVDALFAAEKEREQPRVSALRALAKAEEARSGGARAPVLADLQAALAAATEEDE